jgi:hypothetical protein
MDSAVDTALVVLPFSAAVPVVLPLSVVPACSVSVVPSFPALSCAPETEFVTVPPHVERSTVQLPNLEAKIDARR